ncbi:PREDICTED: kinesin-like protein KIF28P [Elephantulus edwardii]|uniref:kinesin-like protein KIF28P n=1 Tax=Elephantulus edwardii TaxID=28737 RepID=UPI0003F05D02|nr:PREDICTED: kinesin-like protein KIF28P [Elephantulus edwardii]
MMKMPLPSIDHVKVAVRVRPFSQREKNSGSKCVISMHSKTTTAIQDPKNPENVKTFTFDLAYWSHSGFQKDKDGVLISADASSNFSGQRDVFCDLGRGILDNAWQGYNATLLAYGQTGSGKSYSMIGFGANKGIIPNVCEELFQAIENQGKSQEYQVTFSMLEIYNEQVRDLLSSTKKPGGLKIREDQQLGFYVDGLTSVPCENYTQIERLMEQGTKIRTTASTNINASSSRSHMVITIQFKQVALDNGLTKQSSINLVDLAGSERQKSSGSEGDRLREGSRVNLSLTSLGNVISALADVAMGKKVLHIPYRDSILTKLLQSALGGNSRTTLIATISPADICYEETLSTLRYAERAKRIRNKAVVNTWKLTRASRTEESTSCLEHGNSIMAEQPPPLHNNNNCEESEQSLPPPAGLNSSWVELPMNSSNGNEKNGGLEHTCCLKHLSPPEVCFLADTQHGSRVPRMDWAHQLELAREEWGQQFATIAHEQQMMKTLPHLLNVNEDPQLTGVLKFFIHAGTHSLEPPDKHAPHHLLLEVLRIAERHASFANLDGQVTVTPHSKCKVFMNGVPITTKTRLQHLDRIILGSNSAYLYIGLPSERGGEDVSRFDYEFFQLERAAAEGVSVDKLTGVAHSIDGKSDPIVRAVFQDYVKLMPLVAEANQMSEELRKGLKLELKVKNLASSDSRGYDLQKEVMVKVTNHWSHSVWIWSKAKFINRKFLMEEIYQSFLDGGDGHVAQESDPFWDPVEVVHLGSAHIWLQSLAYCMKSEEQVEFLNCDGLEEAVLHVHITPCSVTGQEHGEDDVVIDPLELLGKRIDFQIHIIQCFGVKWLKEDTKRGIQLGYRIYDLPNPLYTKAVWKIVNPQIEETVQFAALHASLEFLNYLQTNALIVDLWGLQEGCAELSSSQQDFVITSEGHIVLDTNITSDVMGAGQATSNQISELYLKLFKLEQETDLLRNINRALREENLFLKQSLARIGSGEQARKPSGTPKRTGVAAQLPPAKEINQMHARRANYDGELAKALKAFYQSMNMARGQFLRLRHHKLPDDDQMLRPFIRQQSQMFKDFGDLLESSLWRLKNDVALLVKKKREFLSHDRE